MATYNLGRIAPNLCGNYDSTRNYYLLDVVYYNGASYIAKSNGFSGKVPTNTTYWQQMAAAGEAYLTPAMEAQIVADIIATNGIVIDSSYNNFSNQEKAKLAGLANANNGQLTITHDGARLGTFSANQSSNSTIDVPHAGRGNIKLVREDNNEEIDSFNVDQKEDKVIRIPVGSGGTTANNGQLTIQYDSSTIGTFTANQSSNSTVNIPAPANGTLTIKRNNSTVATFTADQSGNVNANIAVPVSVADLSDGQSVRFKDQYFDADRPSGSDDLETVKIEKLQCGTTYYCKPNAPTTLEVQAYDYDETKPDCLALPESRIVITPSQQFSITFPTNYRLTDNSLSATLDAAKTYIITVRGFVWEIRTLQ